MNPVAEPTMQAAAPGTIPVRILVVDDDQSMQILASTIIHRMGHQVDTTASGEGAIELFRASCEEGNPYDVIVMDLALPGGISGLEATLAIKQINSDVKVIVSSGYLEQNARNAAMEHGFAGILPKPYTTERLSTELRWVLKSGE